MDSFLTFLKRKYLKSTQMSHFVQFWPILGPYDPLKSPLHHQQSTLNGSYSPKSLHKLVLPENGFISIFFEAKMFKKCPKCHISCNFGQFWDHNDPLKSPLHYQQSLLNGSYSLKSLHKLALPEN